MKKQKTTKKQSEFLIIRQIAIELHDQKICRTPTHNIREHWTADSTLLGLISSLYRNLHQWRSNQ